MLELNDIVNYITFLIALIAITSYVWVEILVQPGEVFSFAKRYAQKGPVLIERALFDCAKCCSFWVGIFYFGLAFIDVLYPFYISIPFIVIFLTHFLTKLTNRL